MYGIRLTKEQGIDLNKELEWLKERSMEDKRLKEKFPKINGMQSLSLSAHVVLIITARLSR